MIIMLRQWILNLSGGTMKETAYPPQEGDHRSPDDDGVVAVVGDDDNVDDDDDENLNNHGGKVDIYNLHPFGDNDQV